MNAVKTPIERILRPLQAFTEREASSGILLLFCTVVAMLWSNSNAA
jgi:Na+/H+ antiporter NhaA